MRKSFFLFNNYLLRTIAVCLFLNRGHKKGLAQQKLSDVTAADIELFTKPTFIQAENQDALLTYNIINQAAMRSGTPMQNGMKIREFPSHGRQPRRRRATKGTGEGKKMMKATSERNEFA